MDTIVLLSDQRKQTHDCSVLLLWQQAKNLKGGNNVNLDVMEAHDP